MTSIFQKLSVSLNSFGDVCPAFRSCAAMRVVTACAVLLFALFPFSLAQADNQSGTKQYIRNSVLIKVVKNWIPTRTSKPLTITAKWKIHKDGTVSDIEIVDAGKSATGEKRAIDAVLRSAPFKALPPGSPNILEVKVQFETTTALQLTVPQVMKHYGPSARKVLGEKCKAAGVYYPPARLTIIGLKQEKELLLYADNNTTRTLIGSYPLVSYSGVLGPKLKEGDLQIPEGIYRITGFQSFNMLALCVDYPNAVDRKNAAKDRRTNLGSAILIHGGSQSTGCLVVSNEDMEQLFVAVHDVGCKNTELIIAPCDLTKDEPAIDMTKQPKWLPDLYRTIRARMEQQL